MLAKLAVGNTDVIAAILLILSVVFFVIAALVSEVVDSRGRTVIHFGWLGAALLAAGVIALFIW